MTDLHINFGGVSEAAGDAGSVAKQLEQQLHQLNARVREVAELWEGASREAFLFQQQRWERAMTHLFGTESATSVAMTNGAAAYMGVDKRGAHRFMSG